MSTKNLSLGRKSVLRLSARLLISFFGLISSIFIQRYFGYEIIGMLAFGASFVGMFGVLGDLGYGSAHIKRVNEKEMDDGKCNGTIILVKSFLSILMALIIFSGIQLWKYYNGEIFESIMLEYVVYLVIIKTFVETNISIFKNIFASKLEMAKNLIPRLFGRFLQMLIKVSIVFLGYEVLTVEQSVYYLILAEIFASILILLLLLHQFWGNPIRMTNMFYIKSYSQFAFPVVFIGVIGSLNSNIDKVMLQFFVNSIEVGIFVIPQKISLIFLMISVQTSKILLPIFSKYSNENKSDLISILANKSVKYISMSLLPFITFLIVFSESFLTFVFGNQASASTAVLQVLLISIYIISISTPYTIQPVSTGHLRIPLYINVLTLLVNLVFNLALIPDEFLGYSMMGLGALGAAITTLISFSFRALAAKYYAYVLTQTRVYNGIWVHIISAIIVGFLGFYLNEYNNVWYLLFPYFILLNIIYFSMLYLLSEFGKEEYNFYKNNLNPYLMLKYIKSELNDVN